MTTLRARTSTLLLGLGHVLFVLINIGIAAWHLMASAWVLGGMRHEILADTAYDWPTEVRLISLAVGVIGILLVVATLFLGYGRPFGLVLVGSVAALSLIQAYESTQLAMHYGSDPILFVRPSSLAMWAIISALYLHVRLSPKNSFKPKPLRGSA